MIVRDVENLYVVSVDEYRFVTHDELLVLFLLISKNPEICVRNVKLVFPLHEKLILFGFVLIKLDDKNTQSLLILVAQHVEAAIFIVVDKILDVAYLIQVIQINIEVRQVIVVKAVIRRCND